LVKRTFGIYRHAVYAYIAMARAGKTGTCDGYKVAARLVEIAPEDSDEILAEHYLRFWGKAMALLDDLRARIAVFKIADALVQYASTCNSHRAPWIDSRRDDLPSVHLRC
jgi:hypothetical protein